YYDINPDNSVGTMHYEGTDCYGDNIEITDWRKYDIAARGPDVIFTFNPYDEGNLVTRIHQDFFCRRLRECTDLLIYTPYFVTGGGLKEHFCTTAGCIYAHKVIVQSEKLRDIYISVFQKNFGNRLGNAKDKFVAMGSPKFDKVVNAKRENYKLCDTWRELIGDKKVVFYNTSVSSILQENEQHLKKIRYDFEVFKERGDIALWWRPHPLSQMTFSSMRPQLLTEYERIVAEYCRDGWGIYDDTPDLHRAIAWSDAYFGDVSSVVTLFKAVCKPALYRNAYIDSTIDSITPSLLPMDFKAHDGSAWLYGANINGLFEFDLSESRIALNAFLDKLITGNEISFTDNGALAANLDGTCGEKIYQSLTAQI
ncbi:MAG: hypothetical protein FWH57_13240, partial [Oscillospiraceae bacterium]|nr:hypothetical protein [Oscillospiraceae bacterium]